MKFTEVKRGYAPDEVDDYIRTLDGIIKSYKEKDNAIKNAIISAQVAADNMIKNARLQADEYKTELVLELKNVRVAVERERAKVREFQEVYSNMIRKYLIRIEDNDISEINNCLDDIDGLIDQLMETDIVPSGNLTAATPAIEFKAPTKHISHTQVVAGDEYDGE